VLAESGPPQLAGIRLPKRVVTAADATHEGLVSPLKRNGKLKLPQGYGNSRVRPEYVSHAYARGPNDYLSAKLKQNVCYNSRVPASVVKLVVADFVRSATSQGWKLGDRRPIDLVVDLKKSAASVGEPFDTRFATYNDLVDCVPKHMLSMLLEAHILGIEAGESGFIPLNRAHIKFDKYSEAKMSEGRWRAIQASDVLTFMLFNHVLGDLVEKAEIDHSRIVVVMDAMKWHDHVSEEMNKFRTVGLDYSNFDETESAALLYAVTLELALASGCSENTAKYLARTAAYTWTVSPSGEVFEKAGGNASGQFLTSALNSLVNDCVLTYCWSLVLSCPPEEVWEKRAWKIVGDDNLMQAESVEEVVLLADLVTWVSGQVVKIDLCAGDLYPVGAHAPFLSRVTADVGGYTVTLPSEPTRLLSAWQVPDPGEEDPAAVYEGLAQELYGYRAILDLGLPWPVPQVVVDFLADYDQQRLENGWVSVPLQEVFNSRVGLSFC